jgi:hypothetical protein
MRIVRKEFSMLKIKSLFIIFLIMFIGLFGCEIDSLLSNDVDLDEPKTIEYSAEAITHLENIGFSQDALIGKIAFGDNSRTSIFPFDSKYMKIVPDTQNGDEIVIEIDFRPGNGNPNKTKLLLSTCFENPVDGYTMNVGDSETNDGNGGDAATQENDAEFHIKNNTLDIYLSDKSPVETKHIHTESNHTTNIRSMNIRYEITDRRLRYWKDFQSGGSKYVDLKHNFLWALNGQSDNEGPVNYKIYVALNRVVKRSSSRRGTGVDAVYLYLC